MAQTSCRTFYITLWFSLELVCKATMTTQEDIFFPLPTNLKIYLYPGIINVTWDCNITKSMEEHTYQIEFPHETKETLSTKKNTTIPVALIQSYRYTMTWKNENLHRLILQRISNCFHEHFVTDYLEFVIHSGLEVNISSSSEWKIIKAIPEGNNYTAAENLHCDVYNVSIIDCSWTVGKEAPEDTQYTLAFRQTPHESQVPNPTQNRLYEPCKVYRTDSFGRQVGCVLKAQKISFNVSIYVQLVGSSSENSIQFFDKTLKLENFVILDPPRNIQLNLSSTELEMTWETPETYSNRDSHCFIYSVNINGDIKDYLKKQSYKASNLYMNEKVNVSVRAKWEHFCSYNKNWSRWSGPLIKEHDSTSFTTNHFPLVLGIITFTVLFLLIFLCHRFQVWKRLFPKIPKPAKKIFETIEQKELLFLEQNITKQSLPEEEEECICLQVTEITQKEQLNPNQYVNAAIY